MEEENKKLPPNWRELDLDIFTKLAHLEAWTKVYGQRIKDESQNMTHVYEEMNKLRKSIVTLAEDQLYILRQVSKLQEVYYHVFPERSAQDEKFLEQMEALMKKRAPDADPKKA